MADSQTRTDSQNQQSQQNQAQTSNNDNQGQGQGREQTSANQNRAQGSGYASNSMTIPGHEASLVTDHGRTNIADVVVSKIVARAACEVTGVHELTTGGVGGALGGLTSRMTGGEGGVNVEVGQKEAAVDLAMIVDYGVSIPQVAEGVRRNIMNRVQAMTGLQVREVNINITDLYLPQAQAQGDNQQHQQQRVQ